MVRHVILWQLKDELSQDEKESVKKEIKSGLEGLKGKVPGIIEIHVHTEGLASSNADLMLDVLRYGSIVEGICRSSGASGGCKRQGKTQYENPGMF